MEGSSSPLAAVRRILLPVDFSVSADRALPRALAFAEQAGAEVDLLHVLVPDVSCDEPAVLPRVAHARSRLDAVRLAYRWQVGARSRVAIHAHVSCAPTAAEGLRIHARRHRTDLLVMATHGWTGRGPDAVGSVTHALLQAPPCPVLVTPVDHPTPGRIGRVHVAFGASAPEGEALACAGSLAETFGAALFVHVPLPARAVVPVGAAEAEDAWAPPATVHRDVAACAPTAEVVYRPADEAAAFLPDDVQDADVVVVPSFAATAPSLFGAATVLVLG